MEEKTTNDEREVQAVRDNDNDHGSPETQADVENQHFGSIRGEDASIYSSKDRKVEGLVKETSELQKEQSTPIYSVFSTRMKIFITVLQSVGSIIAPLSSTIYLPALNTFASDFHVSISKINLTVTCYSIVQAIAPSFYSDLADQTGYRPAIIISYIVYFFANVGLALQDSYGALMGLRALQSFGASATIAIRMGVVAAIVTPAERGRYLTYARLGTLVGPVLGPIIGGALSEYLGWQSIFWFLAILSGTYFIVYIAIVPETNRNVVGDGSIAPIHWYNKDLWTSWKRHRSGVATAKPVPPANRSGHKVLAFVPKPWQSLTIALEKDVSVFLAYTSIFYGAFYAMVASVPTLLHQYYGLSDLKIGICFIPLGIGAVLGSFVSGFSQDWYFRRLCKKHNLPYDRRKDMDLRDFPIERCRILPTFPLFVLGCATTVTYGFALEYGAPLAAILIQQFIMAFAMTGAFNSFNTLLIDLFPTKPSTVTAAGNFARCLFGAGATAAVNPCLERMGVDWTFVFISGIVLISMPILWPLIVFGPKWREERRVREERKKESRDEHG